MPKPEELTAQPVVAVVIPAYRVSQHIVEVLEGIGPEVAHVIVVDDACPDGSGDVVEGWAKGRDARIRLVRNKANEGVGGAMIAGYREALKTDAEVIVKVDGDGQMDTSRIKNLIAPIVRGQADYAKGNRFDSLEDLEQMPKIRIFGNAVLSLMSKFSTGYWQITDPTNGFTAIHRRVLERVRLEKLRRGFFFESDMLFRLAIIRAVVVDVPMAAKYGVEKSNLNIRRVIFEFPYRHTVNALKRTFYNYYLREWNVASFELPLGFALLIFGTSFGISSWAQASAAGVAATTGQVMLSAVPVILGAQLLLAFLSYDVSSEPRRPRQFD